MRPKFWMEVDHVRLSIELLDESGSSTAGRPMMTCSIDPTTRYILNFTLEFCPPNESGKETFTPELSFKMEPDADNTSTSPNKPENGT